MSRRNSGPTFIGSFSPADCRTGLRPYRSGSRHELLDAHSIEESTVFAQYTLFRRWVGLDVPYTVLVAASQQNAVAARKHIDVSRAEGHILYLRLRQQERKLSANGNQLIVVDESLCAKPGAIEDQRLVQ